MTGLVPIGRFATLSGLSVKALRLYDRRGVLRPAAVDLKTGFRYYSPDQVAVAERIRLLRSLDMPLAAIRVVLAAEDTAAIRAVLARHRQEAEERLARQHRSLAMVRALEEQWTPPREREEGRQMPADGKKAALQSRPYACSFCGKDNTEVSRLIAGPNGVFICNDCVARCNELLAKEEALT